MDNLSFAIRSSAPRERLARKTLGEIAGDLAQSAELWSDKLGDDSAERGGLRLLNTELFDAWLLRWPVNSSVTPHDHGISAGVFTVVSGELTEVRWTRGLRSQDTIRKDEARYIAPGVVHDVIAATVPALSIHVYSTPLTSMTYYDDSGLRAIGDSHIGEWAIMDASRLLHPGGRNRHLGD